MANGNNPKDKAMEFLSGQTDQYMLGIGIMIWPMEKVLCGIQMERFILEIGLMINSMAMERMFMLLGHSITVSGIKINSMD